MGTDTLDMLFDGLKLIGAFIAVGCLFIWAADRAMRWFK